MRILIIDNEIEIRETIKSFLEITGHPIDAIEEAGGVEEGLAKINSFHPDLLFLDVEMNDGTGFDLLRKIKNPFFQLVFVTAHDRYAIDAFKFSAIDFLLKPVDPELLGLALGKAAKAQNGNELSKQIDVLLNQLTQKVHAEQRIVVKDSESMYFLKVSEIVYCEADGPYTRFYIKNAQPKLISKNLKEYEDLLEPFGFIRTHHSFLVNPEMVNAFDKSQGGMLVLEGNYSVPISHRKKDFVLKFLQQRVG